MFNVSTLSISPFALTLASSFSNVPGTGSAATQRAPAAAPASTVYTPTFEPTSTKQVLRPQKVQQKTAIAEIGYAGVDVHGGSAHPARHHQARIVDKRQLHRPRKYPAADLPSQVTTHGCEPLLLAERMPQDVPLCLNQRSEHKALSGRQLVKAGADAPEKPNRDVSGGKQ